MEWPPRLDPELFRRFSERVGPPTSSWSEGEYEAYIKTLVKEGRMSCEVHADFPEEVTIGRPWHDMAGSFRQKARIEKRERFGVIGHKADRSRAYLPVNGTLGERGVIDPKLQQAVIAAASRAGITGKIGHVHSHPPQEGVVLAETEGGFTAEDLFSLVTPEGELMIVVIEPNANWFAFKSLETENVPSRSFSLTQTSFARYWYEQCGFEYLGVTNGGISVSPRTFFAQASSVTRVIAERHKLAIYKGVPNQQLRRVF